MQWLNLKDFGIELKRVELSNQEAFPVILITDLNKYKQSGAMPLEQLNEENVSGFQKLPGGKKGRDFNTPIYYLANPQKGADGKKGYKITASLSKLLNIAEDQVRQHTVEMDINDVAVFDAYADFERFNNAVQNASETYNGQTLYLVKKPGVVSSFPSLAARLGASQHELFPKSNVDNIPFDVLQNFGYGTDIIRTAYLNPLDARKNGYGLSELEPVDITTANPVLPVSFNVDGSLNVITNLNNMQPLAYSNFKWEKNIGLINDYNSLVALRTASVNILNARHSSVPTTQDMERHIENLATTLQNYNESNTVAKTYKSIKYNNKGVQTFVVRNENNEWRYVEKEGPKRTDQPLSYDNYMKAITTVANYNAILSGALNMEVKQGADFDVALQRAMSFHQQLYKSYVKEVDFELTEPTDKFIYINHGGQRVSNKLLSQVSSEFERDMGQSLYTEATKRLLSGMRRLDVGNIDDLTGGADIEADVLNPVLVKQPTAPVEEKPVVADVGLSILDSYKPTEEDSKPFKRENNNVVVEDPNKYLNIPKDVSANVAANHREVNDIFKTLQYIELSLVPWWDKVKEQVNQVNQNNADAVFGEYVTRIKTYLEKGGDQKTLDAISTFDHDQIDSMERINLLSDQVDTFVQKEKLKAGILRYHLSRHLAGANKTIYGDLAFNSDANGNHISFANRSEYHSTVQQIKNRFAAENEANNGLVPLENDVRSKLDAFVNNHYASLYTPVEPGMDVVGIARQNAVVDNLNAVLPAVSGHVPVLGKSKMIDVAMEVVSDAHSAVHNATVADNMTSLHAYLDAGLFDLAKLNATLTEQLGGSHALTDHPRVNAILDRYNQVAPERRNGTYVINSPSTGVELSAATKLDVITYLHESAIQAYGKAGADIHPSYNFSEQLGEAQRKTAQLLDAVSHKDYQEVLAAQFLLRHQNGNRPVELSSSASAYAYEVDSRTDSYKVKAIDPANAKDGMVVMGAISYPGAVREAFAAYQVNKIAEDLGIAPSELRSVSAAATAAKDNDAAKYQEAIKEVTGQPLTLADLAAAKFEVTEVEGKKSHTLTAGATQIEFENEREANRTINKIGLAAKLGGFEFPVKSSALIELVDDFSRFDLVQEYLTPDLGEKTDMIRIQEKLPAYLDGKALGPVGTASADFAYLAWAKPEFRDLGIRGETAVVATSIPETKDDLVISRVLKHEWIDSSQAHFSAYNYNLSTVRVDMNKKANFKQAIRNAVADHMSSPDLVYLEPSVPRVNVIEASKDVADDHKAILTQGALWNTHAKDVKQQAEFMLASSKANFEHALNTAPEHVKDLLNSLNKRGRRDISQTISIALTEQNGTELPLMAIGSRGDQFPAGYKVVDVQPVMTFIQSIKGDEEKIKVTDKFRFEDTNVGVAKYHASLLAKAGFDPLKFNEAVVAAAAMPEAQAKFDQKVPAKATLAEINQLYVSEVNEQVKEKGIDPNKGLFIRFGSKADLPAVEVTDSAKYPNSVNLQGVSKDTLADYVAFKVFANNILPADKLVDAVKPLKLDAGEMSPSKLMVARQNFIDQLSVLGKASNDHSVKEMSVYLVDTAVLMARSSDKDKKLEMVVAASPEHIQDLNARGYDAVITGTDQHKISGRLLNPLGVFARANVSDTIDGVRSKNPVLNDILDQFVQIGVAQKATEAVLAKEAAAEIKASTPVEKVIKKVEQTLAAQEEIDADIYKPTLIQSKFADTLVSGYDAEKIATMNLSTLNKEITKEKLWKEAPVADHLASGHQNLDMLILGKAIYQSLPKRPVVNEDTDLQTAATGFAVTMTEMHSAISQSKSVEDFLGNFNSAYRKIAAFDPGLLQYGGTYADLMTGLKKAAYDFEENTVGASLAIDANLSNHTAFPAAYADSTLEVVKHEKLYSGEKSFVHYMDRYTLNAPKDEVAELNAALMSRLQVGRIPSTFNFDQYESDNLVMGRNELALIDGRSPIDYDSPAAMADLKDKWNISLKVGESNKHMEYGYTQLVDKLLTAVQQETGIEPKALGGGFTVGVGAWHELDKMKPDIKLFNLGDSLIENKVAFAAGLHNAVIRKVELTETKHMSQEDLMRYEDLKMNHRGVIEMAVNFDYQPKTEAVKALVGLHDSLKQGDGVQVSPAAKVISDAYLNKVQLGAKCDEHIESAERAYQDIEAGYMKFYLKEMSKKQNDAFKVIDDKIKTLGEKKANADDLYHFTALEKQMDKVISIPFPNSDTMINKFVSEKGLKDAEKTTLVAEVKQILEHDPGSFRQAQEYLAARAAHHILSSVVEHGPKAVVESPDLPQVIKRDLGSVLGSHVKEMDLPAYASKFAVDYFTDDKAADFQHGKDPDDYSGPRVDAMVHSYVHRMAISDQDKDPVDRQKALETLAVVAKAAYEEGVKPKEPEAPAAKAKKEQTNDASLDM